MKAIHFLILFLLQHHIHAKLDQEKTIQYDTHLHTLGQIINIFETRYYKEVDPASAMNEAIKGFAQQDPHTEFLDKKKCHALQEKMTGHFFGIGIVLPGEKKKEEEFFAIIEIIPGGPSDKAGLKAGDKVIQIDSDSVKGLDVDEIMSKLKGKKNTKVILKVLREKYPEPLTIEVVRDVVKDEMALGYYFPEYKVHYLLLAIFSEKSARNVESILKKAIANNSNGVIIDLRNNTGGLFDSAIEIAGLFLPKDTPVVSIKERNGKTVGEWKTKQNPLKIPATIPVFIIVNNYTASASEILAGVLQIYAHRKNLTPTFIVGDETFGKGSVQEVIPLSNEGALKLTTGLYYLPFDTSIQGQGVTPDFNLDYRSPPSDTVKWVTSTYGKEKSLKGTISPHSQICKVDDDRGKKGKKQDEKSWKEKRKEILAQDYFIQNTINLIELYHLGRKAYPHDFLTHKETLRFMKGHYAIDAQLEVQEIEL